MSWCTPLPVTVHTKVNVSLQLTYKEPEAPPSGGLVGQKKWVYLYIYAHISVYVCKHIHIYLFIQKCKLSNELISQRNLRVKMYFANACADSEALLK